MRWARRACWPSATSRIHNSGILFIAYAGRGGRSRKMSGTKAPLFAAIKEGPPARQGRATKIATIRISKPLINREDIGAARARPELSGKPEVYRHCLAILRAEGIAVP